jgi:hypothetical protein
MLTDVSPDRVAVVEYWYISHVDWEQSVREAEYRNAAG